MRSLDNFGLDTLLENKLLAEGDTSEAYEKAMIPSVYRSELLL